METYTKDRIAFGSHGHVLLFGIEEETRFMRTFIEWVAKFSIFQISFSLRVPESPSVALSDFIPGTPSVGFFGRHRMRWTRPKWSFSKAEPFHMGRSIFPTFRFSEGRPEESLSTSHPRRMKIWKKIAKPYSVFFAGMKASIRRKQSCLRRRALQPPASSAIQTPATISSSTSFAHHRAPDETKAAKNIRSLEFTCDFMERMCQRLIGYLCVSQLETLSYDAAEQLANVVEGMQNFVEFLIFDPWRWASGRVSYGERRIIRKTYPFLVIRLTRRLIRLAKSQIGFFRDR